jgi:hypothetical protein
MVRKAHSMTTQIDLYNCLVTWGYIFIYQYRQTEGIVIANTPTIDTAAARIAVIATDIVFCFLFEGKKSIMISVYLNWGSNRYI